MKFRRLTTTLLVLAGLSCAPTPSVELSAVECGATSGPAPFKTRCTVRLGPEAKVTWCAFRTEGGAVTPEERSPCGDAEVDMRVVMPGVARLFVTAMREGQVVDERQVELEALNGPPVIASLTASPMTGPVPLHSRVSWSVTDPNQDALKCEVSLDGVVQRSILDCRTTTDAELTLALGTHRVSLSVTDSAGETTRSELEVTANRPVGDFKIERAELGQTVFAAGVDLVSGKEALLRAIATAPSAELTASGSATVTLTDGGMFSTQLEAPNSVPTKVITGTLEHAFWARIPAEYVEPGMSVDVKLNRPELLIDSNPDNERATVTPPVRAGRTLAITWVPITFDGVTAQIIDIDARLRNMFPVRDVASNIRAPFLFTGSFDPYPESGWSDLLSDMWTLRQADASKDLYFASIDTGKGGDIGGMAWLGSPVASGLSYSADYVAPHEIGHALSLDHAPCGVVGDPNYPYTLGAIGVEGVSLLSNPPAVMPSSWKDMMSYCAPKWVSDYNLKKLRTFVESQSLQKSGPSVPVALIRGRLRGGELSLAPVHRFTAPVTPEAERGVEILVNGGVSHVAQLHRETDGGDALQFVALIPDPGTIRRITLRLDGRERSFEASSVAGSANPQLMEQAGMLELLWNASAYKTAAVRHVAENGQRTTLALALKGGRASVSVVAVPEGGAFELSFSDGLNAVRAELARK